LNNYSKYKKDYSYTPAINNADQQIGVILIHGFGSTTDSMLYLATQLSELGFHVELPTLSGHASDPDDLIDVKWENWIDDIQQAWLKIRKRVDKIYLVGISMGGTLALNFSTKIPFISGIVLINHALFMNHLKYKFTPFLKSIIADTKDFGSETTSILDSSVTVINYDKIPLIAIEQLLNLCKDTEEKLFLVKSPVLIFKSIKDKVIPINVAETTFRKLKTTNKRLVSLYNSHHVATQDFDKELILEEMTKFFLLN